MQKSFLLRFLMLLSLSIFFTKNTFLYAQKIEFGLHAGTGKLYIHEQMVTNVKYTLPTSLAMELKYTPTGKSWGIKLRVTSLQAGMTGENWDFRTKIVNSVFNNEGLNATINTFSTNILLEKQYNICNKLKGGFNIGFGITKENLENYNIYQSSFTRTLQYSNMMLGGILEYAISDNFGLQLQPTLMMQDVGRCLGVVARTIKPQLAGEDVSFFVNLGVNYKLN